MTSRTTLTRVLATAFVVVGCAWSADVWAAPAPVTTPGRAAIQAAQTPQPPPSNEYVGDDTCTTCHTQTLKGTKHGVAADPRTPAAQHGCESCHGPGKAHVDDDNKGHINRFPKMTPRDASAVCATCHNKGDHALWAGSTHDSRSLSCITCHSVHSPVAEKAQLKATDQFALCGTCHVYVDAANRARLPEQNDDEVTLLEGLMTANENSRLMCQVTCTPELEGLEVTVAPRD